MIVGVASGARGEVHSGRSVRGRRLIGQRLDIQSQAVRRHRRQKRIASLQRRHRALNHGKGRLPVSFIIAEHEDTVLANRPAERAPEFIEGQRRFAAQQLVARIQPL